MRLALLLALCALTGCAPKVVYVQADAHGRVSLAEVVDAHRHHAMVVVVPFDSTSALKEGHDDGGRYQHGGGPCRTSAASHAREARAIEARADSVRLAHKGVMTSEDMPILRRPDGYVGSPLPGDAAVTGAAHPNNAEVVSLTHKGVRTDGGDSRIGVPDSTGGRVYGGVVGLGIPGSATAASETIVGAGGAAVQPVTLSWTNPSHLPAYESPGYRCACQPGSGVADTLLDLHHVEVWEFPRRERADGTVCDPPDTSCWFRNPPRVVVSVLAVGRQGMRESFTFAPAWRVATYKVVAVDFRGNRSCASNGVTVER